MDQNKGPTATILISGYLGRTEILNGEVGIIFLPWREDKKLKITWTVCTAFCDGGGVVSKAGVMSQELIHIDEGKRLPFNESNPQ